LLLDNDPAAIKITALGLPALLERIATAITRTQWWGATVIVEMPAFRA
jgi:hypothetical protein